MLSDDCATHAQLARDTTHKTHNAFQSIDEDQEADTQAESLVIDDAASVRARDMRTVGVVVSSKDASWAVSAKTQTRLTLRLATTPHRRGATQGLSANGINAKKGPQQSLGGGQKQTSPLSRGETARTAAAGATAVMPKRAKLMISDSTCPDPKGPAVKATSGTPGEENVQPTSSCASVGAHKALPQGASAIQHALTANAAVQGHCAAPAATARESVTAAHSAQAIQTSSGVAPQQYTHLQAPEKRLFVCDHCSYAFRKTHQRDVHVEVCRYAVKTASKRTIATRSTRTWYWKEDLFLSDVDGAGSGQVSLEAAGSAHEPADSRPHVEEAEVTVPSDDCAAPEPHAREDSRGKDETPAAIAHVAELPNSCAYCARSFRTKELRDRHVVRLHGLDGATTDEPSQRAASCARELAACLPTAPTEAVATTPTAHSGHAKTTSETLKRSVGVLRCGACPRGRGIRFQTYTHAELYAHVQTVHSPDWQPSAPCLWHDDKGNVCGVVISDKKNYPRHMRLHIGAPSDTEGCYECEYCSRVFMLKGWLDKHVARQHEVAEK